MIWAAATASPAKPTSTLRFSLRTLGSASVSTLILPSVIGSSTMRPSLTMAQNAVPHTARIALMLSFLPVPPGCRRCIYLYLTIVLPQWEEPRIKKPKSPKAAQAQSLCRLYFSNLPDYLFTFIMSSPGLTLPEATTSTLAKSSVLVTTVITTAGWPAALILSRSIVSSS